MPQIGQSIPQMRQMIFFWHFVDFFWGYFNLKVGFCRFFTCVNILLFQYCDMVKNKKQYKKAAYGFPQAAKKQSYTTLNFKYLYSFTNFSIIVLPLSSRICNIYMPAGHCATSSINKTWLD